MGLRIHAFIEYDDSEGENPFERPLDAVIPLDRYVDLRGGKDRLFLGAVASYGDISAPFPMRGSPPNISPQTAKELGDLFDLQSPSIGWLTIEEINYSLAHCNILREHLSFPIRTMLATMDFIGDSLGRDRVRLVFGVE